MPPRAQDVYFDGSLRGRPRAAGGPGRQMLAALGAADMRILNGRGGGEAVPAPEWTHGERASAAAPAAASAARIKKMKVRELIRELTKRGLPGTGLKADLLKRLLRAKAGGSAAGSGGGGAAGRGSGGAGAGGAARAEAAEEGGVAGRTIVDYITASADLADGGFCARVLGDVLGSDHRPVEAVIEAVRVHAGAEDEPAPVAPVLRLNIRALVGEKLGEYQAAVRAGMAAVARDTDPHKGLQQLKEVMEAALVAVVGHIKVTGYGSADGTAQAWCTPDVVKQLALKRASLRRLQRALRGRGGRTHEQAWAEDELARKEYNEVRGRTTKLLRARKAEALATNIRRVAGCTDSKEVVWSALRGVAQVRKRKAGAPPVKHPVTGEMCRTAAANAGAKRDHLAALGVAGVSVGEVAAAATKLVQGVAAAISLGQGVDEVAALIEAAELECPRLEGGDRVAGTAQKAASAALNVAVTLAELEKALERCKAGTAPGEDELPYEVYQHLPAEAKEWLAEVYSGVMRTHSAPAVWKKGVVGMLHKKGPTSECSNYRGITLLDTSGKVFERVLLGRLSGYAELHGLIHENQNGFRGERSCEEHVFVLQQLLEANRDCVAVFVDVRKAYPTVFRDGLFVKLAQKGVGGDMWATLRDMYTGLRSAVKVGSEMSSEYAVEQGLMEGAILSPFLRSSSTG